MVSENASGENKMTDRVNGLVRTEKSVVGVGRVIRFENADDAEADWRVRRLIGRGKGGYSWLVEQTECGTETGAFAVLKQIHHEPCAYYHFGDKFMSEQNDYETLRTLGVPVPYMMASDRKREFILKEYIAGENAADLAAERRISAEQIECVLALSHRLRDAGINIDWYPTNFIIQKENGRIVYVDYECNAFDEKWSFEMWGKSFWLGQGL